MEIDMNIIAESLIDVVAKKISENISTNLESVDGKLVLSINVNQDYLRGVQDTISALAEMEVSVFG